MVSESIWTANKTHWQDYAACKDAPDPNIFTPTVETPDGLLKIRRNWCNGCPVLDACLNSAIIRNDYGYWGGTSTAARRAVRKVRSRSKCPVCASVNLVRVPHEGTVGDEVTWFEACLNCAASWRGEDRPTVNQTRAERTLRGVPVPREEVAAVPPEAVADDASAAALDDAAKELTPPAPVGINVATQSADVLKMSLAQSTGAVIGPAGRKLRRPADHKVKTVKIEGDAAACL